MGIITRHVAADLPFILVNRLWPEAKGKLDLSIQICR
jgi:hypothetical protein